MEDEIMAPYAGLRNLTAYLDARCAREGLTRLELAKRLHWPQSYLDGVYEGQFRPSRPRAEKLACFFGDQPLMVLALCDLEADPAIAEVISLYTALPEARKEEARAWLKRLTQTASHAEAG
jgi:transcriptional regulator with XRE-family HTH domain